MFENLQSYFEPILVIALLLSAIAYALYHLTFGKAIKQAWQTQQSNLQGLSKKEIKNQKMAFIQGQANNFYKKTVLTFADFFWVLLFIVVFRLFCWEFFIIPSSSMKPGLQIGDLIAVDKNELGLRLPINNKRLTKGRAIKRGDVIVFKYPKNPKVTYIKRVIGLPGDTVSYDNRQLVINGKPIVLKANGTQTEEETIMTSTGGHQVKQPFDLFLEQLPDNDKPHTIRYSEQYRAPYSPGTWKIPAGQYLVMGDNRDNSADSRDFGLLDDRYVVGHAKRILFNFSCLRGDGQCDRFFKPIP